MSTRSKALQELAVYGFIRMHLDIPDELKEICLAFYLILFDEWDKEKSHSEFKFTDDNILYVQGNIKLGKWRNAFGSLIVSKGNIQTWKIKLIGDVGLTVFFGIVGQNKATRAIPDNQYFCQPGSYCKGYGYYDTGEKFDGGGYGQYGQSWHVGCSIAMTLDMSNKYGQLSFELDGEDQGIAFGKLDVNRSYRMAVATYEWEQKIQILENE